MNKKPNGESRIDRPLRRREVDRVIVFLILLGVVLAVSRPICARAGTLTTLVTFTGSNGSDPLDSLTLSGNTLYGMTSTGGTSSEGTVFSVNTDGTAFQTLVNFAGSNGSRPNGSLALFNGTLYGTTSSGGGSSGGTVFGIKTDGSGFSSIFNFGAVTADGNGSQGSITVGADGTLYGTNFGGGAQGGGTVFGVSPTGTLVALAAVPGTGGIDWGPIGSLVLSGSKLYGMTHYGGTNDDGTIFSVNTDGSGYQTLFNFTGSGGAFPWGSLTLAGGKFYGMTLTGGLNGDGTIFSLNVDGSGFQTLLDFNGTNGDNPHGSLLLSDGTLYGMTSSGGSNHKGNIFSMNTDGTGFEDLYDFSNASDGGVPDGSLILANDTLYGMTSSGGSQGTVFAYSLGAVPEPSLSLLLGAGMCILTGHARLRKSRRGSS